MAVRVCVCLCVVVLCVSLLHHSPATLFTFFKLFAVNHPLHLLHFMSSSVCPHCGSLLHFSVLKSCDSRELIKAISTEMCYSIDSPPHPTRLPRPLSIAEKTTFDPSTNIVIHFTTYRWPKFSSMFHYCRY